MKNSIKVALVATSLILILYLTDTIGLLGLIGQFFLLAIVIGVMVGKEGEKERKAKRTKNTEELKSIKGFTSSKTLITPYGLLAIDNDTKQIAIRETSGNIKLHPYSSILSCEVIEDGTTTYKKTNTLGRAVVGGVIAGGAGAIIGGLTSKEKESKEIQYLDFKIVIKDTNNPSYKIRIFDTWIETSKTKKSIKLTDMVYGPIFDKAFNKLKSWKDTIEVIIDNQEENKPQSNKPVTEELEKLHELKQKGVLTQEEFDQQKQRLLL